MKRTVWLGIAVGWLTQLGLKTILPIMVLLAIRMWSLATDNKAAWIENPDDAGRSAWYVVQASIFFGSILAGMLAGRLSPRRSVVVPAALVLLSLLVTVFEQFPRPISPLVTVIWVGGPCVGLLVGVLIGRGRKDA
jgi:hypothetical protein